MKWVDINKAHFNTDLMKAFYWSMGKLFVHWVYEEGFETYDDPDRKNYLGLCRRLTLSPILTGEDDYGQN